MHCGEELDSDVDAKGIPSSIRGVVDHMRKQSGRGAVRINAVRLNLWSTTFRRASPPPPTLFLRENMGHEGRGRLSHSEKLYLFRNGIRGVCGNAQLENAIPEICAAGATKPSVAEGNQSNRGATLSF